MKVQLESFPFSLTVRRSKKARRMAIHIESTGSVELVLPRAATNQDGVDFLHERTTWIMRALAKQKISARIIPRPIIAHGAVLPCFGDEMRLHIEVDEGRLKSFAKERAGALYIKASSKAAIKEVIIRFYIAQAKEYFEGQAQEYSEAIGLSFRKVRVIAMKTQWGSCNHATQVLTFNWRLALAPEYVARYVVAHEVAHLMHPNHSKRFWNKVEQLYPAYASARSWLRQYGASLHFEI